jgi:hypothetical protein
VALKEHRLHARRMAAPAAGAPCGRLACGQLASISARFVPAPGSRVTPALRSYVPRATPPSAGEGSEAAGGAVRPAEEDGLAGSTAAPRRKYLEDLWRNDFFFMDRRGRRDARKAADGLAFWHELVIAVFGCGERPALQAEAERLAAELEAAQQQARPVAHCATGRDTWSATPRDSPVWHGAPASRRPSPLPAGSQRAHTL